MGEWCRGDDTNAARRWRLRSCVPFQQYCSSKETGGARGVLGLAIQKIGATLCGPCFCMEWSMGLGITPVLLRSGGPAAVRRWSWLTAVSQMTVDSLNEPALGGA